MKDGVKHNCVICNAVIERIESLPNDKEWEGCFADGIVEKISAGYGSKHDGDMFIICICDSCIDSKKLKWVGNYFFPDMKEQVT